MTQLGTNFSAKADSGLLSTRLGSKWSKMIFCPKLRLCRPLAAFSSLYNECGKVWEKIADGFREKRVTNGQTGLKL